MDTCEMLNRLMGHSSGSLQLTADDWFEMADFCSEQAAALKKEQKLKQTEDTKTMSMADTKNTCEKYVLFGESGVPLDDSGSEVALLREAFFYDTAEEALNVREEGESVKIVRCEVVV